jgi:type VI secretion system protein ImpM
VSGPGAFGKLPARGDFLAHRLPADFTEPWHGWLARGLLAARGALGDRLEELWRVAPAWRFALAPGLAGPEAVVGVLVPSVDAVGRAFPLTLALPAREPPDALALILRPDWLDRLEAAARRALDPGLGLGDWLAALDALAPRELPAAPPPRLLPVRLAGDGAELAHALATLLLARGGSGLALFWGQGSPFVAAGALACGGLPEGPDFVRLLADPEPPR